MSRGVLNKALKLGRRLGRFGPSVLAGVMIPVEVVPGIAVPVRGVRAVVR
jgi:hypothetical protein